MTDIHLLVLIHGMWGNPTHLAYMDKIIREVKGTFNGPELAVLVSETNRDESTYDGIDWGGERVAREILEEIKEYEDRGKKVTRFSITGYSLGGLLARYVIGILHQSKFFQKVIPVNFNTVATPHIGIPRLPSTLSAIANYIGPRLLSRTGEQFFCVDKWSPRGRPLLDVLADPDHIFYQALLLFPNIRVYANAVNDVTVPYISAAIEETDLFAEYKTNGLEIEFHDEYEHVVKSYMISSSSPPREREKMCLFTRLRNLDPPVPPVLKGGFPLNLLVYVFLPVIFPTFVSLALVHLSIASHNSRTRLKALEVDESNKERLAHIIAELESNVESAVLELYDDSQSAPAPLPLPCDDAVDGTLPQREEVDVSQDSRLSQALLSPVQRRCIENLNKIPQLKKERAFFPDVLNSHGMIVCRDVKRPHNLKGEGVLRHWANHFEL